MTPVQRCYDSVIAAFRGLTDIVHELATLSLQMVVAGAGQIRPIVRIGS